MARKFNIIINTSFPAIHCWEECPIPEMEFLRTPHRHVFHVEIKKPITHTDRDIEFIQFKMQVEEFITLSWRNRNLGTMSCEQIAEKLMSTFRASYVKVMEDNENGAEIYEN